jgi:hypothetical protein
MSQGFANAVQITHVPTGDGFGIGLEIEYLYGDITLISSVDERPENRGEL